MTKSKPKKRLCAGSGADPVMVTRDQDGEILPGNVAIECPKCQRRWGRPDPATCPPQIAADVDYRIPLHYVAARGGARPGAGRPKGSGKPKEDLKVRISFRLAPDVVAFLRKASAGGIVSQSELIERAIRELFQVD